MLQNDDAMHELTSLRGGLVVSCQAREDNPLHGPGFMAVMAEAAVQAGARGIRANGVEDVAAIRQRVDVPVVAINKLKLPTGEVFITPSCQSARDVIAVGAKLVALDATSRPRPGGASLAAVIRCITECGAAALADVSTLAEGVRAVDLGAAAVGTTLSGYTSYSVQQQEPDFRLVEALARAVRVPVFAEGRIWSPEQAVQALECGASFVVVGTAITNPRAITERYVRTMAKATTHVST